MMFKKLFLFVPILAVSACAYTFDKQYQDVEIRTPGAQDARCTVYANKVRFEYFPPQKRSLPKSEEDLVVDCWAPGNRHREVVIKPTIEDSTYANVLNGAVPGTAWDYASQAMFAYPDVVTVDFTGMPLVPSKLPAHNNSDIKPPEDYYLEEFRPSTPRLNSDRFDQQEPIRRRVAPGSEGDLYDNGFGYGSSASAPAAEAQSFSPSDSGSYINDMFGNDSGDDVPANDESVTVIDGTPAEFQQDITVDDSAGDEPAVSDDLSDIGEPVEGTDSDDGQIPNINE